MKKFKTAFIVFLLAAVFFVVFRLVNLNSIPVFVDEAIYVRWSQVMKAEATLRFLPLTDGKQPLAMWLTVPLLKYVSDPLIAGRLVSVIAGLGTMIGLGLLASVLFDSLLISALCTLIYSVLPFTVFFDRMALADSLLAMFGVWTLFFTVLFTRTLRLDYAMFTGFVLGGGLITKSPAIFFYLWIIISIIFLTKPIDIKKNWKKILIGLLAIIFISQGIYSVLRLGPGFNLIGSRNQDYVFSIKEVLTHPLNPLIGNVKSTINWLWLLFTPTIIVTIILSLLNKKYTRIIFCLLIVGLLPLFGQAAIAKVYTSRYILFAVVTLIPLSALGIHWLLERKGMFIKILAPVIIAVPAFVSFIYLLSPLSAPMSFDMRNGYLEEWTAGWGQKEIANYLIKQESEGEKIVVFTEGYFGTLPDGLQIYTEGHKNITIVGSPPIINHFPEALLATSRDNSIFLVVNKSRNLLSPDDLNKLDLITEYPKAVRKDGTREYLQFYRLR